MFRRIAPLGIAVFAGLIATSALASDLDIINAPEIDVSESGVAEGWYIRGDLGYAGWVNHDKPDYRIEAFGSTFAEGDFDDARFSKPVSYGVGMGYQFNNFLRADLTTDFFSGSLRGGSDIDSPCITAPAGTTCRLGQKADYNAAHLLANGYVDLGTYAGITPYVGAGAGVTYMNWDSFRAKANCENGTGSCGGQTFEELRVKGGDSWRFTYALMAGASVDLTNRVKLDLGYRFTDMAGGKMFSGSTEVPGVGTVSARGRDDGFQKHEIRAGIRVTTW
ncbi:outer membrane beta-barrel protein [Shinella sp. CPCC 100929]|uniref:Outer membrane beta-barrel protein n=1 Tax=Shinella lacus TaxID=2654216 RepID=A0ABT1RGT6_9HYPH|nr:outer membrane beta-barrel protein [Shinella lacus]MCQ4634412.1 outer membrane beta-barrel protein [Shinella lacus]